MKKILPFIISGFVIFFLLILSSHSASAQLNKPGIIPPPAAGAVDSNWVEDSEVYFVGKTASRADDFLKWTLQNYNWLCVTKTSQNVCDNTNNPLVSFWVLIRNIVYAFIALFVLATAFVLIITRGQNVTVMRFVPRFIFIIVLITLSFSLVQFIYQVVDIIQSFFLTIRPGQGDNSLITTKDLLFVGFDYKSFVGMRLIGPAYDESAFISLLLVRLTAITYYVMTGILLIRKIILWFFIVISPIFPLLYFYKPIRNTAKIWIGEFFRWLLYAPLFAIFLHGLVVVWQKGIPLAFDFTGAVAGDIVYPTAVSILLGGPGQSIGLTNSVNLRDTFAEYVVALLMLWVVILLPFILLKIFLDYLATISFENNTWLKQISPRNFSFLSPPGTPQSPTTPPSKFQPAGIARALPFMNRSATVPVQYHASIQASVRESANIMQLANLSIPRMRDVANYETSMMSRDVSRKEQVSHVSSTLQKIGNPASVTTSTEREKFTNVRQKLMEQKQKGNPIASSILAASAVTSHVASVAGAPSLQQSLPSVNRVQQVSLEDYEEVRKLWTENYETLEPPKGLNGEQEERRGWIKNDIDKINQAISLLSSVDPEKVKEGMSMVSTILPFLLIGGFSKSEVIAYLKAKMESGKQVLANIQKREEEEESKISARTESEKPKEAQASAELEESSPKTPEEDQDKTK